MTKPKTFVLRAKVTTSSPTSTQNFGTDNEVVIPMAVYERLNTPHIPYERRSNAAGILNYISNLVSDDLNSVAKLHDFYYGLYQPNGSKLFILSPQDKPCDKILALSGLDDYDKKIFQLCLELQQQHEKDVRLISKNPVIREKAMILGIKAEPFKDELAPTLSEQYTGKGGTVLVSIDTLPKMYDLEGDGISMDELLEKPTVNPYENMFFRVSTRENEAVNGKQYVLGRYSKGRILPLKYYKTVLPDGFIAKNDDQKMMMECLLAPASIAPFVVIKGAAGVGKTFGAVSSALSNLDQHSDNPKNIGHYNTFAVAAPIVDMTKEKLGYLPGSLEEKAGPYLGGFMDNIKHYFRMKNPEATNRNIVDWVAELFDRKLIEITPANYLRGRSITNSFFMLDEAQNYDPSIILDITTRGGEGTKIILMGDPTQINNPDLNVRHNGVVYGSESMKGDPLCWQITLEHSVRSPLAQAAIRRMRK